MAVHASSAFISLGDIYHNNGETKQTNGDLVYCHIYVLLDLNDLYDADIEYMPQVKTNNWI